MPTIAVTGATGRLGRLVVTALLDRGVEPGSIVAVVRTPERAADLADRGVEVRRGDYEDPASLREALAGVDRLLLVSSSEVGRRAAQHGNAIDAAKAAGVSLVAYTSVLAADTTAMLLAEEHRITEGLLADSGLPVVLLRNGWYTENYLEQGALEHGIVGAAGDGRVAPAPRADYAAAAAEVLAGDHHAGATYELAGDVGLTLTELASLLSDASGRTVTYTDLPVEQVAEGLAAAGLPAPMDVVIADTTAAIGRGELETDSGDLARLIGRPTTPAAETLRAGLAATTA